jgi:hypothetical protein
MRESIPIVLAALLLSCAGTPLSSEFLPAKSIRVQQEGKWAILRTLCCDVHIRIYACSDRYRFPPGPGYPPRYPVHQDTMGMECLIYNTTEYPISFAGWEVRAGGKVVASREPGKSSPGGVRLEQNYRYLEEGVLEKEKIHEKDLVPLALPFIPPGDRIVRYSLLEMEPWRYDSIRIRIHMATPRGKKVIDFDFRRLDYRHSGKNRSTEKSSEELLIP